jgi:hypothetical protein
MFQVILFLIPAENDGLLTVRKCCKELESLYLSKTLTETEIYSSHQSIEIQIFEGLRKTSPEDTIKFIDFDKPLEAYFILGSIFSTETLVAKPFFNREKDKYCVHLYNRCLDDSLFREQFTKYVVWSDILKTSANDPAIYMAFIGQLAKYKRAAKDSDKMAFSSLMFVVYSELFGIFEDYNWQKWDEAMNVEFASMLSDRQDIQTRIIEGKWQRFQGYMFRERKESEKSNRINVISRGEERVLERLSNHSDSFLPILPFNRCSESLIKFLEHGTWNVSFRIVAYR